MASRAAGELAAKVALQRKAKDLEKKRNDKRRDLFQAQDEVDTRKDALIGDIETRLKKRETMSPLFVIRWKVE